MKNWILFLVLSLALITLNFLTSYTLNMDELLVNSLSEQLTKSQLEDVLKMSQKWQWVGYVFIPLSLIIKISLISAALYMGAFLFSKKITYTKLFSICIKAEFIFVLVSVIKLIWFAFSSDYILEDVQSFYPLSALSIVGYEGLSKWFVYPFQTLNLFELAYWIALAYLIGKEIKTSTDKALKIVASSYGSALLIWVVAMMFLTLNMS